MRQLVDACEYLLNFSTTTLKLCDLLCQGFGRGISGWRDFVGADGHGLNDPCTIFWRAWSSACCQISSGAVGLVMVLTRAKYLSHWSATLCLWRGDSRHNLE